MRLQLVPNRSQELFALFDVFVGLHPFGGDAINDAEDPAALFGLRDDHLYGVCSGADDVADLGDHLHRVQDVDRERSVQKDDERMPGTDRLRVFHREVDEGNSGEFWGHKPYFPDLGPNLRSFKACLGRKLFP